ncbi:hypothetical protein AgCh_023481 [Apium graveolens]
MPNLGSLSNLTALELYGVYKGNKMRDVLYTGETVTTVMDDGVYTGVNSYSYYTEVKEESLIKDHNIEATGFKKVAKVSPSGVMTLI